MLQAYISTFAWMGWRQEKNIFIRKSTEAFIYSVFFFSCANLPRSALGPVARSLVSANRWLRGIKMYRFPWYLTLVSTNHALSNPGQTENSANKRYITKSLNGMSHYGSCYNLITPNEIVGLYNPDYLLNDPQPFLFGPCCSKVG